MVFEIEIKEKLVNLCTPYRGGLLQTMQGFLQSTNKTTILPKAWGLLHINLFKEISM
jgi:hypothetical protein